MVEILYELILRFGHYLHAEEAVFETLCLVGVLVLTLLSLRESRKSRIALKKAKENLAKAASIRKFSGLE